ncbi:MAG: hypothetical protein ABI999_18820 [Acidobacteriota bacterium]
MKLKVCLFVCILGLLAISAFAQGRTVTNFDLEKYRTQRVAAERDLRENYEKLGFSSPEERAKREEAKRIENEELAARFERERIERETAEATEQQAAYAARQQNYYQSTPVYPEYGGGFYTGFSGRNRFRGGTRFQQPSGYFAGGAFWPAPTTLRIPLIARPARPRH